jgi:hypothetical protein
MPNAYLKIAGIALLWILLESHKILLEYLPVRYLISFYASIGLFISVMFAFFIHQNHYFIRLLAISLLSGCLIFNAYMYNQEFKARTFNIQQMNYYFQKIASPKDVIIGPWAPAFTWLTKGVTYPIWSVYTKDKDIMKDYRPNFIVSEYDQNDSDNAFKKSNINLLTDTDSLTQIEIALWKINVYAIKP